jgi:glycosyltransferase involved in cell wall biosynthesis
MPELFASKFGDNRRVVLLLELVERLSASFADRVLTVSKPTWKVLVDRGISPRKLEIVMNTADERIFSASDGLPTPTHNSDGGLTLVSHGVLIERYGYQTILHALTEIREIHPRVRLLIMGNGEYESTLHELVRELELEENVVLLGFKPREEVVSVLRSADIGVTANTNDIFTQLILPTKLMEYVALGIPAVVSRLPAVEEYFDETMVNFFDADDPKDLASVVCSVAGDLGTARATAERTRETFLNEYGWKKMKGRYIQLVDELAGPS